MQNFEPHKDAFRYRPQPVGNMVELRIEYRKDGRAGRGIYLSIQPVGVERRVSDGICYETVKFLAFSGAGLLVQPLTRANPRQLAAVAERFEASAPEISSRAATNLQEAIELVRAILNPPPPTVAAS